VVYSRPVTDGDDKQLSRRERRRAEREAEERDDDERPEEEESEAGDEAETSDDAGDDAEESESEGTDADEGDGGGEAEAEEEERAAAPAKPEKKKKKRAGPSKTETKRAKQEEKSATANIRDRNKRLREQAAAKRRSRRDRERDSAVAQGLDASEMVDDVVARGTHRLVQFGRKHFNIIQWVLVLGIAGGIGWSIFSWRTKKTTAKSSDALMVGVDAELGRVATEAPGDPQAGKLDPRPTFTTEEERLKAAEKGYEAAATQSPGSGTAILAKLGEAGIAYDQGKFDDAKAAYESVLGSELAKHDADVKLRALEGVGLCLEAKGDADGALKSFTELEKSDEPGFGALGMFHQARVLLNKGEKDKAKDLLAKVSEKLAKEKTLYQGAYIERASKDLMAIIDPASAPATATSFTPEQLDALKEQITKDPTKLKKMLESMGKMTAPEIPMPSPMPEAPKDNPEPSPAPSGGAP
jgi:tetratricopeptide (TPR) repeat protein